MLVLYTLCQICLLKLVRVINANAKCPRLCCFIILFFFKFRFSILNTILYTMSCSIIRFNPLSVVDTDEINNPEWYLKLYPSCIVSFTDSTTGIYLRSTQCGNNIVIQESNTINFLSRIDYVVVRYNNGTGSFTQWKLPGTNTLDYYSSNLVTINDKLRSLVSDGSITITPSGDEMILTTSGVGGDFVEINDISNLNNTTTKKIKNLEVSGLSLTNYDDKVLVSSGNCLLDNGSNLIIPDTKMLNTFRVTDITKSAADGKVQLTSEDEYLTLNVGNCLSRYQQDGNLSNIQSSGYCRSVVFPDGEFTVNTTNGSQLRLYNNKLISNSAADTSGVVSNLICRNSSAVVQNELKNIVAGSNITLTSADETLTIGVTSMSGADFGLFKWTTFTKTATPGQENANDFYGFDIGNNQYIYLINGINMATFEIENDTQDYLSGIPTKTCIFDLSQSSRSCYVYWETKFSATWLRQGCVYQFIYTPSTGFAKFTMLSDTNNMNTQYIDTLTAPYITIRELHNRDTYRFSCAEGQTNTLLLYTYDEIITLGCSIDIYGMNMNTSGTVLNIVLCNSEGTPFTTTDSKKINYKFTSTPHISRNVGFNPNWASDHEVSFYLSSDNGEYLNVLHLDISSGDYVVWY